MALAALWLTRLGLRCQCQLHRSSRLGTELNVSLVSAAIRPTIGGITQPVQVLTQVKILLAVSGQVTRNRLMSPMVAQGRTLYTSIRGSGFRCEELGYHLGYESLSGI